MRILVIEDEQNVAEAIALGLRGEAFDVDLAPDGDTGLWMAREHDYGVIVLDVMLPGRNGHEVCATLRAEGDDTPVLMLTARTAEREQVAGLETGADDYMTKPFSFPVLVARIRALLRRGPASPSVAFVTVGDIEIDRSRRRVHRNGSEVELTHREFALLEALAANPGFACSRSYLLDQVWGPEFDAASNVLQVYIGYLRRKLDTPGACTVIETIVGHGYRLRVS